MRWRLWNDRALFDSAGRLTSFVSIGRDTTEARQRAEAVESSGQLSSSINQLHEIASTLRQLSTLDL